MNAPSTITYLALGDSYTIGEGVEAASRFPAQTAALLRRQGITLEDPVYVAATGWTTADLMQAIAACPPGGPFHLVTLLAGVNDQYQGMDAAGYGTRFGSLLKTAIELAGGCARRVVVLSIPDYSATPFVADVQKERIRQELDRFNAINRQLSAHLRTAYLDITPLTRAAGSNPSLLAADKLHYSAHEYGLWAQILAPCMKKALGPVP